MRKFCSYGPVNTELHYYVPRTALVNRTRNQLVGENPAGGGHYITVWAPRQAGKTWVMQQVLWQLREDDRFDVLKLNLEHLKMTRSVSRVVRDLARRITEGVGVADVPVRVLDDFHEVFRRGVLERPLILILDEFDALSPTAIAGIASVLRNIYVQRQDQADRPSEERDYLLHGVALVGVRAVLGIESQTGSPFNVQRSVHIPNLTPTEVREMYNWYAWESGQMVKPEVVERVYHETRGQPGLVSWLGELLTEEFNRRGPSITARDFEVAYAAAVNALPNANVLNIISKARQGKYRDFILRLFRTDQKIPFRYDDPQINFLYTNGVIDQEVDADGLQRYVRFSSPFVQKRLFNYFAGEIFADVGTPYRPFEDLSAIITPDRLDLPRLLRRYERYLAENREWLLRDVPRRQSDMRPYEAVHHFALYRYLSDFLAEFEGQVVPEFPTGNGKIDLLIRYGGRLYGLEVKSYTNRVGYRRALQQAARYGRALGLEEITLALFVEAIDEAHRARYEVEHVDAETGVTVRPVFIATGC